MTTPPLDLTAHDALHPTLAEAVARGDAAYGAGGDAEAVALAAAAPLLARAEAAEKKVAKVRDLHKPITRKGWRPDTTETVCSECVEAWSGDHDNVPWPCPTITALDTHTPETETTP